MKQVLFDSGFRAREIRLGDMPDGSERWVPATLFTAIKAIGERGQLLAIMRSGAEYLIRNSDIR